uniref:Uncharacterized protein n=1 Tax=Chromera velia CCMP2878 TaxID=1169474 RepID=A0A0G4HBH4_9ALVE|eukprot:Cvel_6225.t1-p1 / transcript=Cvel_6225.t1 / gene=Cvel_6225 / organism=Chromera_velia_CCMP2878 / gene_product=hypothetical protein / transcript_product=hypothetical protein / location=Cvel_scaffold301:33759-34778(-) / protein_length=340 / sequence_SO=supercontig / SO=protein_coding / is_pseudo=false
MPRVNAKQMSRRTQREARAAANGPQPLRDLLLQMQDSFRQLRPQKEEAIDKLLRVFPFDAVALKVRVELLLEDVEPAVQHVEEKKAVLEYREASRESELVTDEEEEKVVRLRKETLTAVREYVEHHRERDPEVSALFEWRAAVGTRDPDRVEETGRRLLRVFRRDGGGRWFHRVHLLMAVCELRRFFRVKCQRWSAWIFKDFCDDEAIANELSYVKLKDQTREEMKTQTSAVPTDEDILSAVKTATKGVGEAVDRLLLFLADRPANLRNPSSTQTAALLIAELCAEFFPMQRRETLLEAVGIYLDARGFETSLFSGTADIVVSVASSASPSGKKEVEDLC